MNMELKEAFKSEFYISTDSKQPDCKLWHSIGAHISKDGITIFNVNTDLIATYGPLPFCVETLKGVFKSFNFKRVKGENKWTINSTIQNYDATLKILENFDTKMDPETKKTRYE